MRAGARPAITLAPGQVWLAEDGTSRTVTLLHPATSYQVASCQCLARGKQVTIAQTAMRVWILRTNAVLEKVLADAG